MMDKEQLKLVLCQLVDKMVDEGQNDGIWCDLNGEDGEFHRTTIAMHYSIAKSVIRTTDYDETT